jgi:hypothetical protein
MSLVKTPISEIMATLETLSQHGVTDEMLKMIRSDRSHAEKISNYLIAGAPGYEVHTIKTLTENDPDCGHKRYRNFTRDGWTVQIPESITWDPKKVCLLDHDELYKEPKRIFHLTPNVLFYLLKHQELIPSDWYDAEGPIIFCGQRVYDVPNDCEYMYGITKSQHHKEKGFWKVEIMYERDYESILGRAKEYRKKIFLALMEA